MDANGNGAQNQGAKRWPDELLANCLVRKVFVCGSHSVPSAGAETVRFPRLELPLRGKCGIQTEIQGRLRTVEFKRGAVLFLPAKGWRKTIASPSAQALALSFETRQIQIALVTWGATQDPLGLAPGVRLPWPLTGPVRRLVQAMTEMPREKEYERALPELVRALLTSLRCQLASSASGLASHTPVSLEDVCEFLRAHHLYEINRDVVAERFGISPSHLSRLFQRQGQPGFSHFLAQVRVEHAKNLLREAGLRVDDVAIRCGFRDAAYFCRVFKGLARLTPGEYRDELE